MDRSRRHIAVLLLHVFVWGGMAPPAVHWISHGVHNRRGNGAGVENARAAHEQQSSAEESRVLINSITAVTYESAGENCKLCALHTPRLLWQATPAGAAAPTALHTYLSIEPPLRVAADFSLFQGRAPPCA